ncbi:MAG TPA: ammonium transporter [Oscillatoriaceae cyanobacterium]
MLSKKLLFALALTLAFAQPALAATGEAAVNSGDTAFVLISAALVLLMTPGLGFFYGGMVQGKNVVNTLMLSFGAMALVSVQWVICGYSLAFAPGASFAPGLVGSLKWLGLNGVGLLPNPTYAPTIPHQAFMIFQCMFAIITPALISGSIVERVRFTSFMIFMAAWTTLVYDTVAHWAWSSDGWLHALGALDFAGGTVVHITSGVSGLVAAMVLGPRADHGQPSTPNNLPFVILGASMLWFGWFGFNAGSALSIDGIATLAFVTTHTAAAAGACTWMAFDHFRHRKVTVIGAVSGMVAGLVAITPAAGYVSPMAALAFGALSAVACYVAQHWKDWAAIDDTLDAFTVHGVGGILGALLTGVFACKALNPGGANGLLYGNPHQLVVQAIAVAATVAFSAGSTFVILKAIAAFKGLRVQRAVELQGLDTYHTVNAAPPRIWYEVI